MLKRAALVLAILLPAAWSAASIFVASYEPGGITGTALRLETSADGHRRWQPAADADADAEGQTHVPDSARIQRGGATYGSGGPEEGAYDFLLLRGALDAGGSTIPLALGCVYCDWTPLRRVRLEVTSDPDWAERDVTWTVLATGTPDQDGRWQTIALEGGAPPDTVAVQLATIGPDGESWTFGTSLRRPDDWPARLREDLAAFAIFRWFAQGD